MLMIRELQSMSDTKPAIRYPLGLPEGSVRAVLALAIFGTVMYLLLQNREIEQGLWMLTYTILGYYYTLRRSSGLELTNTTKAASPLHLPRGSVRWLLFLMYGVAAGWLVYEHREHFRDIVDHNAFFPLCSITSFFVGLVVERLTPARWKDGTGKLERRVQDIRGLLALLSAVCIVLCTVLPDQIPQQTKILRTSLLYVFFYFGNR
jgi:hypothetical protein